VQTLRWDDSTVSALARQLGVDWHTLMNAVRAPAADHLDDEPARAARLGGVDTLGVDEYIWRPAVGWSLVGRVKWCSTTRRLDALRRAVLQWPH